MTIQHPDTAPHFRGRLSAPAQSVEAITTLAQMAALRDPWTALHARDPDSGFYLSWAWMNALFQEKPDKWVVLTVRDPRAEHGLAAVFPLRRSLRWSESGGCYMTQFTAAGRLGMSEYAGFVCDPALESQSLATLASHVAGMPWSDLSIRYEPTGRRLKGFAAGFPTPMFRVAWPEHRINAGSTNQLVSPQITLDGDFESWRQTRLGKTLRKGIGKFHRRYIESGDLHYTVTTPETLARDSDLVMAFWEDQWRDTLRPDWLSVVSGSYRAFLARACALGVLYMPVLWEGTRCLGGIGGLVDRKTARLTIVVTGRNQDPTLSHVGTLLHSQGIRHACETGMGVYDFGHGDEPYKYVYGAENCHTGYLHLTRSRRSPVGLLDPLHLPQALAGLTRLLERGKIEQALSAARHLSKAAAR